MKPRLFLVVILLLISIASFADAGSCAIYKCKLSLKNGAKSDGYFQIASYSEFPTEGDSLLNLLKKMYGNDKEYAIKFYSQIFQINYPKRGPGKLTAAAIEHTSEILIRDIQTIEIQERCGCEWSNKKDGSGGYSTTEFSIHYYHPIIDELTLDEIKLLDKKPIYRKGFADYDLGSILVLNYNPNLNEEPFESLVAPLDRRKKPEEPWKEYYEKWLENYARQKELLRKQNIVVISFISYT